MLRRRLLLDAVLVAQLAVVASPPAEAGRWYEDYEPARAQLTPALDPAVIVALVENTAAQPDRTLAAASPPATVRRLAFDLARDPLWLSPVLRARRAAVTVGE